jgi:hypothetical protein
MSREEIDHEEKLLDPRITVGTRVQHFVRRIWRNRPLISPRALETK